jgi:hypothetical protein
MPGIGGSSPSVQQVNNLTGQQSNLFNKLGDLLGQNLGQGVPAYPGQMTPPASSLQNQAFGLSGDIMNQLPSYLQNLSSVTQPWNQAQAQNWWQTSVADPAMSQWKQQTVPNIMEQFSAYNAANSGPAQQALSQAGANLETGLAANRSNFLQQNQQQSIQNMLQGLQLGGNLGTQTTNLGLQAGGTQYGIQQAGDTAQYQEWLRTQPYNNPYLKYLEPFLTQQTFSNVGMPGQQSGIGGMMGGLGGLLGGVAAFL